MEEEICQTEMLLNYASFKERNKELELTNRKMLFSVIRASPREVVIEILKKLKIIHDVHDPKTKKLKLVEREEITNGCKTNT